MILLPQKVAWYLKGRGLHLAVGFHIESNEESTPSTEHTYYVHRIVLYGCMLPVRKCITLSRCLELHYSS